MRSHGAEHFLTKPTYQKPERQMSGGGDLSSRYLATCTKEQPRNRVELPVLGWPADLFKCDAADAENLTDDVALWHNRSISIHSPQ